jgi:hypothetical protein
MSMVHVYGSEDDNLSHVASRVLPGQWRGSNCGSFNDDVLDAIVLDQGGELSRCLIDLH